MIFLSLNLILTLHISMVFGLQDNVLMPGDAVLAGLLDVTQSEDGSCGKIIHESVQTHEAVRWFFRQLNERDYIPGVTLGFHAYQTCGQPARATHQTFNILDTYDVGKGAILIGLLGPDRSSETQHVSRLLSSFPKVDRLPQISYSATADTLQDRSVYKNLFRVIQPDTTQVEVIIKLMQKLNWNYVGVIYEDDAYGRGAAEALKILAEEVNICIPVFVGIAVEASTSDRRMNFTDIANRLEKTSDSQILAVVFFGQASTAEMMFDYIGINLKLEKFQLIVSESLALNQEYVRDANSDVYPRAKGLLTPTPPYYDVQGFQQFWVDLHTNSTLMLQHLQDNDWLRQYLDEITKCKLGSVISIGEECLRKATEYIQTKDRLPMYIPYALLGAASFAKAVKELHNTKCESERGICTTLRDIKRNNITKTIEQINVSPSSDFDRELSGINITFRFQNGHITYGEAEELSTYDVYNLQRCEKSFCFKRVGKTIKKQFSLTDPIKSYDNKGVEKTGTVQAQCQSECKACKATGRNGDVLFIPGDFYIVGLVPIHSRKPNELECGIIRNSSLSTDVAEAAHFAVRTLNQRAGVLKTITGNATFGLVLLDTCVNPYITLERVIAFNTGTFKINKNVNSSDILQKVIGYIGPARSSVSVPFGSAMNEIKKVYISYSSTSPRLSDREKYPYFMRTSSSDDKQANVIMELAKRMKSIYVQILYSYEEYGIEGRDALLKAAKERKVCVAQSVSVPDTTDSSKFQGLLSDIRRYPHAKVIIIFLLPHMIPSILDILHNYVETGEFAFIGAVGWPQREEYLVNQDSVKTKFRGSFSITQKVPKNNDFEAYYKSLDIEESSNPWLQDYIEDRAKCYFSKSFNKRREYRRECSPALIDHQRQTDTWVPFAINTVYALALGFHEAVSSVCGGLTICQEYSTEKLIEHIKNVRLDIYNNSNSIHVFDENGDGNVDYTISQIVGNQTLSYKEVGRSTENGIDLFLPVEDLVRDIDFTSLCQNDVECKACRQQFGNETKEKENVDAPIATLCLAAVATLFFVIAVGLMIYILYTRKIKTKEDPYLSVIPDPQVNYEMEAARNHADGVYGYARPHSAAEEANF